MIEGKSIKRAETTVSRSQSKKSTDTPIVARSDTPIVARSNERELRSAELP
jgi:hypothetical protein